MASEKIAMTQQSMVEEQQARIGNQKWTQYLAAFIGNFQCFCLFKKIYIYKTSTGKLN